MNMKVLSEGASDEFRASKFGQTMKGFTFFGALFTIFVILIVVAQAMVFYG